MKKGLRVLGHPVHAMISDFPLALLGTSLLWDAAGIWRGEALWWAISFWNIALGLVTAIIAAIAGAIDYAAIEQDSPALGAGARHMMIMLTAVAAYSTSLLIRGGHLPPSGSRLIAVLMLEGAGLGLLVAGGWYGGLMVFRYGIGRDEITRDEEKE